jgi:hypothetical protein
MSALRCCQDPSTHEPVASGLPALFLSTPGHRVLLAGKAVRITNDSVTYTQNARSNALYSPCHGSQMLRDPSTHGRRIGLYKHDHKHLGIVCCWRKLCGSQNDSCPTHTKTPPNALYSPCHGSRYRTSADRRIEHTNTTTSSGHLVCCWRKVMRI